MNATICPCCGNEVGERAVACSYCGCLNIRCIYFTKKVTVILLISVSLLIVTSSLTSTPTNQMSEKRTKTKSRDNDINILNTNTAVDANTEVDTYPDVDINILMHIMAMSRNEVRKRLVNPNTDKIVLMYNDEDVYIVRDGHNYTVKLWVDRNPDSFPVIREYFIVNIEYINYRYEVVSCIPLGGK